MVMDASGGCSRDTSVVVVVLETSEVYIIISLSTRTDTQVIYVDPTTGSLCYLGRVGHDIFRSEEEALNCITNKAGFLCKSTTYARAILGYSALGSIGLLLVATRLSATVPHLPGGGCIYTVTESQWIKIQLQNPQSQGKGELKNIQELSELDIDGKHYFCETRDITHPFPSCTTSQNPDDEFVWNTWFSKPFKDIGLPTHCIILLQGFAECRSFSGLGQQRVTLALLARRSRLHPGTRYLARGLNACSSTGNEVECEQLVWVSKATGENVQFSSYIWRRGTIPIWWGAELKLTAAEAEIYVSSRDPYRGSLLYYQRLSRRYGAQNSDLGGVGNKKSPLVPIVLVNLLRNVEGKPETILVEHFKESLKYLRATGKLASTWIQLINYDWHANVKSRGEQQTVEGLWKHLKAPTVTIGFCEGIYFPSLQRLKEFKGSVVCNNDVEGGFCLRSLQNGVVRFNCADSLDRTNAASFFGSLQVLVEQCRRLGVLLDKDPPFGFSSINRYAELDSYGGNIGSLPPGWEERSDAVTGKSYYIDHNTRNTTWEHPCQDKPWKRFDMTFNQFKSSTQLAPINQLADLFLLAGDIHATLYTGSKAMHSHILNIFSDDGGKFSKFSTAQNVKITLQRRYQNVLVDSFRQKQLEMFLGLRLFKHLPSVPVHPLKVLSRPSGCLLKPVASMFGVTSDGSSLLNFKKKDIIWVCPPAADVVELFIYLNEPCHVCKLLLTVAHGAKDTSYPWTVDVRTGCNLDGLKLVLEGACIPQCSNGTNLLIPLTGRIDPEDVAVTGNSARLHAQENSYLPLLYDFEELEGELNFLTRVVALTFYSSGPGTIPVTLGEIEVLGVSLPWNGIFTMNKTGRQFIERLEGMPVQSDTSFHVPDTKKFTNPFSCDTYPNYTNSGTSPKGITDFAVSLDQPCVVTHGVDLLTGDIVFPQATRQAEDSNTEGSSGPVVSFDSYNFGDMLTAASTQSEEENREEGSATHRYIALFKSFFGSHKVGKVEFALAIKLEIERLSLNLSAAERDRALLSIGIDPATIDPNGVLDDSYIESVCSYADSLAFLGYSAFEDEINASIGLERVKKDVIDFWNINGIGETCSGNLCEIRAEIQPPIKSSSSVNSSGNTLLVCFHCGRKACKVCCAGKGAVVLISSNHNDTKICKGLSNQSAVYHGGKSEGTPDSKVSLQDNVICKLCCSEVLLYALYVDNVRVLSSLRRRTRADNAAKSAVDEILGHKINISSYWQGLEIKKRQLDDLLNGDESLAEFPYASLLHTVETAVGSEPLLSLLAPLGIGEHQSYWRAPPTVKTVEFSIVLGTQSDVSGVVLIISSCGYSISDCPKVQIWASNKIHREDRSYMGEWDVQSVISTSSELHGPEKSGNDSDNLRHVKFHFRNSIRCRIVWIKLILPQIGSSSVSLEESYDLLCLDESSPSKFNPCDSIGETVRRDSCIHAKRLVVFGHSLRKEIRQDESTQVPEMLAMNNFLQRSPRFSRFRIPIEAERFSDNNLVLEQYLSPTVPGLEGFRLDAFNVILPRITHSPCSLDVDTWESSLTCLEDCHIMPAIVYLQVSVIQEPRNVVRIGEYRLPMVKGGTALYFDFPQPIEARRVIFKLLGDVTAFVDDITEQDESNVRNLPLACGLSLSNKIKLYYYADPYELGKLASLSAI